MPRLDEPSSLLTRRNLLAAALVVAALLAAVHVATNSSPDLVASRAASSQSAKPPSAAKLDSSTTTDPALPDDAAISAALQREFMEAPDLYAFAMNAKSRPHEGGTFYAQQAASYCRWSKRESEREFGSALAAQIARTSTLSARAQDDVDRYFRRCAGFQATGTGVPHPELEAEAVDSDDPLIAAEAGLRRAKHAQDREGAVRALTHLLDLHDPLLLSAQWVYLANPDRESQGPPGGLWFEDHDYRAANEYALFMTALENASCTAGAPCARDALAVLACAYQGLCVDSAGDLDFLDDDARRRTPQDDARLHALIDRMRAAIARSDVDAFRAPGARASR